ncbi:Mitogen-activated protein kinase kinase kinase [Trema orientale]|uniref:Mitogen-activated protein kinase kinase kinase n=1 Tax=Trema orientale TaxID=63057 RepID=A0A2P5ASF4_TREOI|nr:Mitogen-activated protein kinase kinase kinase [Trema orientale]
MIHLHGTSFYLFLTVYVLIGITDGQPVLYSPEDNIALDCGSTGDNIVHNRSWNGDINSKFFPLKGKNNASIPSVARPPFTQGDSVPYGNARLSRSEFTYSIPVIPGPKFIRLHFYAATYDNLEQSKAFFSVEAGQYSLLSNFSAYLTAAALGQENIVKEFCAVVVNSTLNIRFTPSSSIPDAYAFINGIEVVSMPTDLYYLEPETGNPLRLLGQKEPYQLIEETALEKLYRVNIGGNSIPEASDTGMFRSWDREDEYLTIPGFSRLPVTGNKLSFQGLPNYTAPDNVYRTARSMGNDDDKTKILSYRLTWEFQVDYGFYYFVRLHFCEIQPEMNETGARVFQIFIANQIADERADVFGWAGGQYIPYVRDYAVPMYINDGRKKQNLSVALQAIGDGAISTYTDAILNGIEIFKLNDSLGNLAGPNPDPKPATAPTPSPSGLEKKEKNNRTATIGIVAGVVSGAVVILSVIGFLLLRRGRKVKGAASSDGTTWWGPISFTTTKSSKTRGSSSLPSDLCRYFSLAEIKAATNHFEDIFIIGVGGFGNVYKGYIDSGTTPVAIKRLKAESSQGVREFRTEIEMLSHLRHRHLVSLIGYCNDDREMILVYDYMAHGTLRSHLYNTANPPLAWKQRLEICIGAARGLHYLHTGSKYTIIHRDVKTTNILLDEKWVAKVSDFGLSKMGPTSTSKAHVSTVVKGSIGYLDPEYYRRQQLTEKSDVYSFGVVLCEVLCGRPPIVRNAERRQVSLAEWARSCYHNGTLHQIIDPQLTGRIAPECLKKYGEIAMNCMLDNGTERPSMNDVVWGLEFAMQLQQNAEDNDRVGGEIMKLKGEDEVALINNNNSDGPFTCSWEDTAEIKFSGMTKMVSSSEQGSTTNESMKGVSGTVFSEIIDPKGR